MLTPLFRWLALKRYQFEVTTPMYMMTPAECFILYSIIFLLLSLVIIAGVLYLPEHVAIMASRASYYWAGQDMKGRGWWEESAATSAAGGGMIKGEL